MKNILIPGGAGFIGSHTVLALNDAGYRTIVFDNLSNGHRDAVITGDFIGGDIRDSEKLASVFKSHDIDAVIHFAAFIEAGESVKRPLTFYDNNVSGSLSLLNAMLDANVKKIVFSSTAAVYGELVKAENLVEDAQKAPINPYGDSKWMVECMLRDAAAAHGLNAVALRYFNAAGADPDGRLGERHDPETHLIPLVLEAATGVRPSIKMFGTDYETRDGTCIRDYIHVADLANAHVKALDHLFARENNGGTDGYYDAFNLGNGNGYSVREVIDAVKKVTGLDFPVEETKRRPGDPAYLVAEAKRAKETLGWEPRWPDLEDMAKHAYHFLKSRQ